MDVWTALEGLEGISLQTVWEHPFRVDRVEADALVLQTARGAPMAFSRESVETAWEWYVQGVADFAARLRNELGLRAAASFFEAIFDEIRKAEA